MAYILECFFVKRTTATEIFTANVNSGTGIAYTAEKQIDNSIRVGLELDYLRVRKELTIGTSLSGPYIKTGGGAADVNGGTVEVDSSKVLLTTGTLLSSWRATGDVTKIDGGKLYTGSVITSALAFTPLISAGGTGAVVATINASTEGITINATKISISGSTTFSSGYDPTTKVAAVAGTYASAASGARLLIFPDANTALQIIDNAGNDTFKALVGGTDVGDVIIGNYAGGQGIKYDKSAATTTFKGAIEGSTITGGTVQTSTGNAKIVLDGATDRIIIYGGNGYDVANPFYIYSFNRTAYIKLNKEINVPPSSSTRYGSFGITTPDHGNVIDIIEASLYSGAPIASNYFIQFAKLIIPGADNTIDIGADSIDYLANWRFKNLYLSGYANIGSLKAASSKFLIDSNGAITKVNNIAAGTAGKVLRDNGTSFTPAILSLSDLTALTASKVCVTDASGFVTASAITATTLSYLDATSSIQTQINAKATVSVGTSAGSSHYIGASYGGNTDTNVWYLPVTINGNTYNFLLKP